MTAEPAAPAPEPAPAADSAPVPAPATRTRLGLVLRVVTIAVVVIGVWLMLRGMQPGALGHALAQARLWPIAIAAALNFGILVCKAMSWWIMLAPQHPVALRRLLRYTITSFAASVLVPARAGELLRVWLLRKRDGVPATRSAAVAVAEKLLDVVSMLIVIAPVPWLVPGLPASVGWWIGGLAAGALVALIALRVAVGRSQSQSWLGRFIGGMDVLRQPRRFAAALAVLVLSWLIDLAMIDLVLWAVGIDLPIASGLLVLFTLNVSIAIPSTPGQVGALELGAMAGLRLLHVPEAPSLAFALLYHAMQVVPLVVTGLILDYRLLLGLRSRRRA